MKKSLLLLILMTAMHFAAFCQYQIGSTTITFNDPSRTGGFGSGGGPGRQIQCEIYYPSATAGTNTPVSAGSFPVIVFGHGFAMVWSAYQNIWEAFVPKGYIMVFPRTEGSLSPSHNDFALDMRIAVDRMQLENSNNTSLFFQKVSTRSAVMGHSMGGGSTVLSASSWNNVKTIVCLAPAETNPSAVTAAANVSVPALVFSGDGDAVTPPNDHHIPIFNALGSSCKTFLSVTGGGHCYFANSNFNCDFGETTSGSTISLSRAEQQDIAQDMSLIWFNFYLKSNCPSWDEFLDSLQTSTRFVENQQCNLLSLSASVYSNAANCQQSDGSATATPNGGLAPYTYLWDDNAAQTTATATGLAAGTYHVTITDANGCSIVEVVTVSNTGGPSAVVNVNDAVCNGGTGSVNVTPTGNGPFTYDYFGENPSSLSAGNYTVEVTDANGCSGNFSFTVTEPSAISSNGNVSDASAANNDGAINISVSGGTAPYTFMWSNGSQTEDQSGLAQGTYSVTITDANNCTATFSYTVNAAPNGIEENMNSEFLSFPNPFSSEIYVSSAKENLRSVRVYDVSGRMVWSSDFSPRSGILIHGSEWLSGIYILEVEMESGSTQRRRIIKQ
ncbi:MAG: T9SS type A sorting domain-containing protein [Flavobacteriales bacterium]|nr:T9SS type A sorting domain-containing protein [Flavobacteriales bacterium]